MTIVPQASLMRDVCMDGAQARQRLPAAPALALLRRRSEPLLRGYLEHLVLERGDPDPALHTELALALAAAALRLMPPLDARWGNPTRYRFEHNKNLCKW